MGLPFGRVFGHFQLFVLFGFRCCCCCCFCFVGNFRYFRRCLWDLRKIYYHDERKLSAAIIFICVIMRTRAYSTYLSKYQQTRSFKSNKFPIRKRCFISLQRTTFSAAHFPIWTIMTTITIVSPQQKKKTPNDLYWHCNSHTTSMEIMNHSTSKRQMVCDWPW